MTILRWEHHWGEPERAPHWRVLRTSVLYHHHHHHYHHISICRTAYHIFLFRPKRMAIIYKRWNIHVTWSPIEAKSTCRLLLYSTLTGTMLRLSSNMDTSESLFGSVCSQIALTERIILNAAHNYQRLWKLSRKCPPGVSAPSPLLHGLLELPVFASQFAVPTNFLLFSGRYKMQSRGPLLTDSSSILGYLMLLPPTLASACLPMIAEQSLTTRSGSPPWWLSSA